MKKVFIPCICFLLLSFSGYAQFPKVDSTPMVSNVSPGKLLTQFSSALKPASFTNSWAGKKSGWIGKAQKVTDAIGIAKTISSLTGFIKPSLFKDGFNVQSLAQTANKVKTMTEAAGLLKNVENGLKPEAFSSNWSGQRNGWLAALNLLN